MAKKSERYKCFFFENNEEAIFLHHKLKNRTHYRRREIECIFY